MPTSGDAWGWGQGENAALGATGALLAPLAAPLRQVTSLGFYGAQRYDNPRPGGLSSARPFYAGQVARGKPHEGVDLVAHDGEPVYSMAPGIVESCGAGAGGVVVCIRLDQGAPVDELVYADLGSKSAHPGDRVDAGDVIGHVGARAFVHVGLKRGGRPVNPAGIVPYAR